MCQTRWFGEGSLRLGLSGTCSVAKVSINEAPNDTRQDDVRESAGGVGQHYASSSCDLNLLFCRTPLEPKPLSQMRTTMRDHDGQDPTKRQRMRHRSRPECDGVIGFIDIVEDGVGNVGVFPCARVCEVVRFGH
jgi:hypothetical protein